MSRVLEIENTKPKTSKFKVSALIPTYCDKFDKWKDLLLTKHLPSYKDLVPVDNLEFIYNCQGYNEEDIQVVISAITDAIHLNPTWSAKLLIRDTYDISPVSMTLVRKDIAKLSPDANVYIYLDDDVVFHDKVAKKYDGIIRYMMRYPRCGVIMSAGFMGGSHAKNTVKLAVAKNWWTNRGLFIRNISDESGFILLPDRHVGHPGGLEELSSTFILLEHGYYTMTSFNNNTHHRASKMDDTKATKQARYDADVDMHRMDVSFQWFHKFVLDRYGYDQKDSYLFSFGKIQDFIYNKYYKANAPEDAYHNKDKYELDLDLIGGMI